MDNATTEKRLAARRLSIPLFPLSDAASSVAPVQPPTL
jgi:hypothetical protein